MTSNRPNMYENRIPGNLPSNLVGNNLYKSMGNGFYKMSAPKPMHQTMMAQDFSYKKNAPIDSIKNQMQQEANQKIQLVSEKKELEFLIEDQKEAQESLKGEFERLTRDKKMEIERLTQINTELENETEKQSDQREMLAQEVEIYFEIIKGYGNEK